MRMEVLSQARNFPDAGIFRGSSPCCYRAFAPQPTNGLKGFVLHEHPKATACFWCVFWPFHRDQESYSIIKKAVIGHGKNTWWIRRTSRLEVLLSAGSITAPSVAAPPTTKRRPRRNVPNLHQPEQYAHPPTSCWPLVLYMV